MKCLARVLRDEDVLRHIEAYRALLAPTDDRIGQDCCTCSQPLLALVSAGALMWRLFVELHHGKLFSERAERTVVGSTARCCAQPMAVLSARWTAASLFRGGFRSE